MSSPTIIVSGLDPSTTSESLDQFFSFCGKIKEIDRQEKSAMITFEKVGAAQTSLMLDGGTLDGAIIHVVEQDLNDHSKGEESQEMKNKVLNEEASNVPKGNQDAVHEDIKQEDKPRSAICAEYLAHGYVIGDQAISKAIALDQKHGISAKFMTYFQKIQEKAFKSSPGCKNNDDPSSPDNPRPKTSRFAHLQTLSAQQYEKALRSSSGSKVLKFYTDTSKQIFDVHSEAKRIAEEKVGHPIFSPMSNAPPSATEASSTQPAPPSHP